MDVNNYVLSLAALTAWREERGNGLNGCLGVLFVIKNRAKAGWDFGDIFKIITQKNQFDSMVRAGDPNTVVYPEPSDQIFSKLVQYVDGIMDGTIEDTLTQGAKYYADLTSPGYTKGGWFDRQIVQFPEKHPRVATVGSTTYFT
jgi:Cell Wall Hydrolase